MSICPICLFRLEEDESSPKAKSPKELCVPESIKPPFSCSHWLHYDASELFYTKKADISLSGIEGGSWYGSQHLDTTITCGTAHFSPMYQYKNHDVDLNSICHLQGMS